MSTIRIDEESGTITYNCHNMNPEVDCPYHNCGTWTDLDCRRADHQFKHEQPQGLDIVLHVSHPDLVFLPKHKTSEPDHVAFPPCPGCGATMTMRVYTDAERMAPTIVSDQQTGLIHKVEFHPKANPNTYRVIADVVRRTVPHPDYAHLTAGQIAELQARIQQAAPAANVSWMQSEVITPIIHGVVLRPHVVQHDAVAKAMRMAGKMPPTGH